jgi:hypothetical protein
MNRLGTYLCVFDIASAIPTFLTGSNTTMYVDLPLLIVQNTAEKVGPHYTGQGITKHASGVRHSTLPLLQKNQDSFHRLCFFQVTVTRPSLASI